MLTQKEPVSHFITVEGYQVHVTEWGIDKPKSILLWHGFERNGRDFDHLAESLAKEYRVLCPDTIGRGLSQWASKPEDSYCFDLYEKLALKICEVFGFFNLDFLGTGMGGALGIRLAIGPLQQNINHLIINDAAPQVEIDGLNRILSYSANPISFTAPQDYEDHLRSIYDSMGYLSDAQWRALTLSSLRRRDDGTITVDFDPGITEQFFDNLQDYDLWDSYQKITCPTLILRGQSSDILTTEVFAKMCEVNENATGVEFPNCGHAPALNKDQQIYVIEEFLKNDR
ncbi:alpha/beta fold hydrolase [Terasakiella pusilla]|uniref:alpha/beta fold hydrolase n=1 Tax=Terasakiella pusilla TaxID=64973 RepID=UPI003AA7DAAF